MSDGLELQLDAQGVAEQRVISWVARDGSTTFLPAQSTVPFAGTASVEPSSECKDHRALRLAEVLRSGPLIGRKHAHCNPDGFTMFVGADPATNLIEIGVVDTSDGPIIIHAMPARPKYLR